MTTTTDTSDATSVSMLTEIQSPAQIKAMSVTELEQLAQEIRDFMLDTVSQTGGHIGANLGTVELSIALHAVFDSPAEPIIWDTGHQGYTHKILTGRAARFPTLNTYGGMNRFVTRTESEHDIVEASHAGTSLSIATGIALARRIQGDPRRTVAVIGDSALAEGMALEALNHIAVEDLALTLVINDNGYAISPGFGGLHEALQDGAKARLLFESWGLRYQGPVDGHDVGTLLEAFRTARGEGGVNVVHVKTVKGKGWKPADDHPLRMHFSFPFDRHTGQPLASPPGPAYQDVAAAVILDEMTRDDRIVCITPSTLYATGLTPAFEKFPQRCFDPGMEEQHALTMSVGLALQGMKPVVAYQSTFLQRAFDQMFHDVCFMSRPILMLGMRSGFAGYDNPTHHGIYDYPYLRGMPNLRILYPKDRHETERMVRDELRNLTGPVLILMPYGPVDDLDPSVLDETPVSFAQPQLVQAGKDLLVVAVGHKFAAARDAVQRLRAAGIDAGLVNLRYLKPLPADALAAFLNEVPRVVSVEEYVSDGSVGGAMAELITDRELACRLLRVAVPTTFVEPGSNAELEKRYRLDADGIITRIRERWGDIL